MLHINKKTLAFIAGVAALSFSGLALSDYVPFPGKKEVRLIDIEAANVIRVNFETWPGYARSLSVKLPDLELPGTSSRPKPCEMELAQKALDFTRAYIGDDMTVTVNDMRMQTSADEHAVSNINTKKGSLAAALKREGLARSSSVDIETPWCK